MAYTKLIPRSTPGAGVQEISRESAHYRLTIPSGKADRYRLAQLDDYTQIPKRSGFPLRFPLSPSKGSERRLRISLSLSARTSSDSIAGTWGFGFWNDPFGMSLGLGGNPFRLPALPNAVWFFGASKENYLLFKDPLRPERSEVQTKGASTSGGATNALPSAQREGAANGFMAQTFRSPRFHPLLIPAGLALPFSRKTTRRMLGRVIEEDGIQLWSQGARSRNLDQQADGLQRVDPAQWHGYRLDWDLNRVSFKVDDVLVFESQVSPNPPLGLVIWIDNQYAAFTPEGKMAFGVLEGKEEWLEVKEVQINRP